LSAVYIGPDGCTQGGKAAVAAIANAGVGRKMTNPPALADGSDIFQIRSGRSDVAQAVDQAAGSDQEGNHFQWHLRQVDAGDDAVMHGQIGRSASYAKKPYNTEHFVALSLYYLNTGNVAQVPCKVTKTLVP